MQIEPQYKHPEDRIELEPFARHNWQNAEARDWWDERLAEAAQAKQVAEWRSVMDGQTNRKAAIIHVSNQTREKWLRRVGDNDLVYRDIRYSEPYGGFAHKFYPTDQTDPERITYSVIAESEEVVEEMVDAELNDEGMSRHRRVGELLGFPDCCLDFFAEHWLGENGRRDPMYEITCNSECAEAVDGDRTHLRVEGGSPYANIMWKYFGWSFVTHIPCSWDCSETAEIGRERYRIMAENGYEMGASALSEWLSEPHEWTGYHGLAEVSNRFALGTSRTDEHWEKKTIEWLP